MVLEWNQLQTSWKDSGHVIVQDNQGGSFLVVSSPLPHLGRRKRGGNNQETAPLVAFYIDISIQLASNTKLQLSYADIVLKMDATYVSGYWTTWVTHYYIKFYDSLVITNTLTGKQFKPLSLYPGCTHKSETVVIAGCLSVWLIIVQHSQFVFAHIYVCMYVCMFMFMFCAIWEFVQSWDCVGHSQNFEIAFQSRDCTPNLEIV